jgi:Putative Flp pilus-assembly TadE/G-like
MLRRASNSSGETRDGGQVLVIFALALVAIVAMTGLVIDGGSAFVQRRDQQNVADSAAMAAGYAYANGGDATAATTAARSTAAANGYVHGVDGVSVDVTMVNNSPGRSFVVSLTGVHRNSFSSIVGMPTWPVSTTATAKAGLPNAVIGPLPVIFNEDAFIENGSNREVAFDEPPPGSEDVPTAGNEFNWTEFCNECNADSNTVRDLIVAGGGTQTVRIDSHISPLNAGSHTTLFDAMSAHVGGEFAVPIVDDDGRMVGFATFHLTGAVGGSTKQIRGYFVSPINPFDMEIIEGGGDGGEFGSYKVYLTN